MRRGRQHLIS